MREKMNTVLYRRWPFEGKKENRFSISALKICIGKCRQANSNLIVFFSLTICTFYLLYPLDMNKTIYFSYFSIRHLLASLLCSKRRKKKVSSAFRDDSPFVSSNKKENVMIYMY